MRQANEERRREAQKQRNRETETETDILFEYLMSVERQSEIERAKDPDTNNAVYGKRYMQMYLKNPMADVQLVNELLHAVRHMKSDCVSDLT